MSNFLITVSTELIRVQHTRGLMSRKNKRCYSESCAGITIAYGAWEDTSGIAALDQWSQWFFKPKEDEIKATWAFVRWAHL